MIQHVSPQEAHDLLQNGDYIYLDVRTTGEFVAGHAPDAVNIPLMEFDESAGRMLPNDAFMRVVRSALNASDRVLVGCQSGGRSLMAAQMMESEGFTNPHNIIGGFGGKTDALGNVVEQGWVALGLPVEEGGDRCYADLKEKANT